MSFVLDSSVTLAWCFRDEHTPELLHLLRQVRTSTLYVPAIWPVETANVLSMASRKGRLDAAEYQQALALLESLHIQVQPAKQCANLRSILTMTNATQLTAYDAEYLSLALDLGVPLATLDKALRQSAVAVGISLLL